VGVGGKDGRRRKALRKQAYFISLRAVKGRTQPVYISKVGKKPTTPYFWSLPDSARLARQLLEKGICTIDGKVRKIKAKVPTLRLL
jgi:hypothetical protein